MSKPGKRPMRSLTAHEKLDAIRRVHEGESKASVARDIGVPESTLRGWCKNEDKISYLSRQSSPEADDSTSGIEPKEKKMKLEEVLQPYNLSKKANGISSISPNTDFTKTDFNGTQPLNLNIKCENNYKNNSSMTERNKAELARLSVNLGLNQPETFLPNNTTSSFADNSSLRNLMISQWVQKAQNASTSLGGSYHGLSSNTYQQHSKPENGRYKSHKSQKTHEWANGMDNSMLYFTFLQLLQNQQNNGLLTTAAPISANVNTLTTSPNYINNTSGRVSTTVSPNYADIPSSSVSTSNVCNPNVNVTSTITSLSTPTTTSITSEAVAAHNSVTPVSTARNGSPNNFWHALKNSTDLYSYHVSESMCKKQILYQRLTNANGNQKEDNDQDKSNNTKEVRHTLDELLSINNNNIANISQENIISESEGLMHGDMFLKFLRCLSNNPSITQRHVHQFNTLLDEIKSALSNNNSETKSKCKMRRK